MNFSKSIRTFLYYFSVIIAFLFTSCGNKGDIAIDHLNFADEIELQQNLVFTFNQDLVPDSLLNIWLDEEYITFKPKVEGRYKWINKGELLFSPSQKFEVSTDYEASLNDKLTKHQASKGIDPEQEPIRFHTPYLQLNNINIFWAKNAINHNTNEIKLNGSFNYPIDINDLKSKLRIKISGVVKEYQLHSPDNNSEFSLEIAEEGNFDEKDLVLNIEKGLKFSDGIHRSNQAISFQTTIPSKDNFLILSAEPQYQDSSAYIEVSTNQQLLPIQDFNSLIQVGSGLSNKRIEVTETGFLVHADFKEGESYQLRISPELKGIFGGRLKTEFEQLVIFGEQKPNISFVNKKGIYLTSKGNKELGIRIINVPKVKVTLYKIYENNISSFLRSSGLMNDYYEEGYEDDYYLGEIENYGDLVYEKEINTSGLRKSNGLSLLNVNFNDLNDRNGLYVASVASTEDQWLRSSKLVCISDIGLIAKETEEEIWVFAHSIISTEAQEGVEVSLVSSNNQQIMKASTDKDGLAVFKNIKSQGAYFNPQIITAKKDADFSYLHFQQTRTENSRFDVGGLRQNPSGYQAYIYGDREIYRPGETIQLNTIIRNQTWEALTNVPIKVKLLLPNGKELNVQKGMLNKQGALASSFAIPQTAVTGTYQVEVYTANDVMLNSKSISVEEFMPDRIKVNSLLNKTSYELMEPIQVNTLAQNLFGPPASNRNYEIERTLSRKEIFSKVFHDFDFSLYGKVKTDFENELRQGITDKEGKAQEVFEISNSFANSGILQGKIFTTVFDESGRPVHQLKLFDVFTQNTFLGVKISDSYVATQQPMNIDVVAIDKTQEKSKNSQAIIEIFKYDWQTVLEKDYGSYRYVSQKKVRSLEKKLINISNLYHHTFRPLLSGEYEVRISLPNSESYLSKTFYAYGWGTTNNSSFEVNKEGTIDIVMDKETYQEGDKAHIIFKTPFAGKLLVTIEREKVLQHYTIQTDKRAAVLDLDVEEKFLPNVYVTATLIKPIVENQLPLTVAHGFAPLMVENPAYKLPVSITAPSSVRSKTKQRIAVKAGEDEDIELTVAVVDEGILQLKNTSTPNPYQFFFQKRALEVTSYDLYPKLLPEFRKMSTGGDGYNLEKRVNPMSNKRVKPVAFWSGQLRTDSKGMAYYDVDIPSFSGDLRIMAIAYDGKAFGSKAVNMKVADPIVISTSLPRFLSPQDCVMVNVTLSNTTNKVAKGNLKISSTGAIKFSGNNNLGVQIAPNSEQQFQFVALASNNLGEAKVSTQVEMFGERFSDENSLVVRPATSLAKISQSGMIKAGETKSISNSANFIPTSVDAKLLLNKSPLVEFSRHLDDLISYPYGCVEQTVSSVFPQLYLADIAQSLSSKVAISSSSINYNIQEAIQKLQSMQLPSGGLSYWQGGYEESWWGSIYAAHFLHEARKSGFEVNAKIQEKLYQFLSQKLKNKAVEIYYYKDQNGTRKNKQIAAKEICYSLYILAMVGHQDLALMNYYKSNLGLLALDSRYLLAATFKYIGDDASFRKMLPNSFSGEEAYSSSGGSFYSYIRDMAISLNTILEVEPNHSQVGIMAKHLSQQLKNDKYLSTQELSFSLIALGKIARKASAAETKAAIKSAGKIIANYTKTPLVLKNSQLKNPVDISVSEGELYYFYETEGIPLDGKMKEEDSFIKVRRTFLSRNGVPIYNNQFSQNDLIIVKISIQTTDQSKVENIVITDLLPAGFEVENPRLTSLAEMPWLKDQAVAEHQDFRDDRINFFTSASGDTKDFYYSVRAVSKGNFRLGTINADAMYQGEYHSYHGAGEVSIK